VAPADAVSILPGEEQLPLFRTAYLADDGRTRRVFGGLVPVSRREAYIAAAPRSDDPQTTGGAVSSFTLDPRLALLKKQVTEPWRRVIDRADATEAMLRAATSASTVPGQSERERTRKEAREQIQTVSWYVLLDSTYLACGRSCQARQPLLPPRTRRSPPPSTRPRIRGTVCRGRCVQRSSTSSRAKRSSNL
jgi:hypothetical protein